MRLVLNYNYTSTYLLNYIYKNTILKRIKFKKQQQKYLTSYINFIDNNKSFL